MRNDDLRIDTADKAVINEMFLKHQNNQDNLVLETNINDVQTLEDILLGLGDIKDMAVQDLGPFDNIDIRLH